MAGDPRIRGEHESSTSRSRPSPGSSPHTRGALGILLAIFIQLGIIPAYAGSTSTNSWRGRSSTDHPRIRGEHPESDAGALPVGGSSPHTRGAPQDEGYGGEFEGIIPAYAGSTSGSETAGAPGQDHPRIRGEHRYYAGQIGGVAGSSPHTRGALERRIVRPLMVRIIPAYAGSTGSTSPCGS